MSCAPPPSKAPRRALFKRGGTYFCGVSGDLPASVSFAVIGNGGEAALAAVARFGDRLKAKLGVTVVSSKTPAVLFIVAPPLTTGAAAPPKTFADLVADYDIRLRPELVRQVDDRLAGVSLGIFDVSSFAATKDGRTELTIQTISTDESGAPLDADVRSAITRSLMIEPPRTMQDGEAGKPGKRLDPWLSVDP